MKIKTYIVSFFILTLNMFFTTCQANWKWKDPTKPSEAVTVNAKLKDSGDFVVNMILVSPERTIASINGKIVKVGDKINEAIVVAIEETKVFLRTMTNTTFSVSLYSYIVEKKFHQKEGVNNENNTQS
jgi:hypothetical protein